MRVDSSLLDAIAAVNSAATPSSSSLRSSGTTASFSSELKSAAAKETTKPVAGESYAEILTGPRAGMYINTSGNARDGDAFVLVKHDGREDHVYGTGKDRQVVGTGGTDTTPKTDAKNVSDTPAAPSSEKSEPVAGHPYADILNGKRSGMFLNTSGNVRDGKAFVLVKRDSHAFHIYGSGSARQVIGINLKPDAAATTPPVSSAPATSTGTDTTTGADTTTTGTSSVGQT